MDDAKEEVRARLNIEDVIGEYVQLKRAGRSFKGLSPFTGEKTPSFFVSPEKHIWHDFSSNRGGDIFSFIMEVEGLDFRQSLELLARKAGVDLTLYQKAGRDVALRKKRLLEAMRLAVAYYQQTLLKNQHALEYVFKVRGLTKQTVTDFQIGYAPEQGSAIVQFLARKGFSKKELDDAGLTNRFGTDLFRGRMMVPLLDESGQAIGFTGRIIVDDPKAPKYLNTSSTLLYDKSRHIFGLSQAKEAIRTGGYSVMVEGNLDVISSHQAGVPAVVATAGTALTEQQLRTLKRLSGQVRIAFDGDRAGVAATERAIPIASSLGLDLMVVSLPEGANDPDELIQQGVSLWEKAIKSAKPAVDWMLGHYKESHNLKTAEGKRRFSTAALGVIRGLQDPVEQDHYLQVVAKAIGVSEDTIKTKFSRPDSKPKALKSIKPGQAEGSVPVYGHIDTALGAALSQASLRGMFIDVDADIFTNPSQQIVVDYIATNSDNLTDNIPVGLQKVDEYVKVAMIRAEKRYDGWREDDIRLEIAELLRQRKTEHRKKQLEEQIKSAEDQGDDALVENLRREHYSLIKETKRG